MKILQKGTKWGLFLKEVANMQQPSLNIKLYSSKYTSKTIKIMSIQNMHIHINFKNKFFKSI